MERGKPTVSFDAIFSHRLRFVDQEEGLKATVPAILLTVEVRLEYPSLDAVFRPAHEALEASNTYLHIFGL
jgi:hypothetical protein